MSIESHYNYLSVGEFNKYLNVNQSSNDHMIQFNLLIGLQFTIL